jgi:hypothetical protein
MVYHRESEEAKKKRKTPRACRRCPEKMGDSSVGVEFFESVDVTFLGDSSEGW